MGEYSMDSSRKSTVRGISSIVLSSTALLLLLIIVPLTRVLPERIGMMSFFILAAGLLSTALSGVIIGARGLHSEQRSFHLAGLIVGEIVLIAIVVISLLPWFR